MVKQNSAKRLSAWERQGVIELHEKGQTQREIASALNISLLTVNRVIQKGKKPRVIKKPVEKPAKEPEQSILDIDLLRIPDENTMKTDILIAFRASLAEIIKRLPEMDDNGVVGVANRLLSELNKE